MEQRSNVLCYRPRSYKDSRKEITAAKVVPRRGSCKILSMRRGSITLSRGQKQTEHAQREHHFIVWAEADRACKVRKTTHTQWDASKVGVEAITGWEDKLEISRKFC